MITSRMSSMSQTTIPQPIRIALGLLEGDGLAYQIDGDRVILRKAEINKYDPFATLR